MGGGGPGRGPEGEGLSKGECPEGRRVGPGPEGFGVLGLSWKPQSPNVHIYGSRPSKNTTKDSTRRPLKEREERKLRREMEKRAKIWAVRRRRSPAVRRPEGPNQQQPHQHQHQPQHKNGLAKIRLAIGHKRLASVSGKRHRAVRQDPEDVPTKSFACAWMMVNSSSCSWQRKILHVA